MRSGRTVEAPDGERWRVRRRWLDRPLPQLRKRLRERRVDLDGGDVFDALTIADGVDSLAPAVAIGIVAVVLVLVLVPLLGIALESLAVLLLLGAGAFGRFVLRRPWIVEAKPLDGGGQTRRFAVRGWRASGRAVEEIAAAIAVGASVGHEEARAGD